VSTFRNFSICLSFIIKYRLDFLEARSQYLTTTRFFIKKNSKIQKFKNVKVESWHQKKLIRVFSLLNNSQLKRMVKDKNKPKRGLTAFMFFSKERRDALKVSDPKLEFGEIAKKIGAEWKTYDDKKKAKYVKLSDKDKARYLKEMKSYVPPPVSASDAKKKKKRKKDPNAKTRLTFW
jgi:hypothetical protein